MLLQLTDHLARFQRLSVERAQLLELPDAIAPQALIGSAQKTKRDVGIAEWPL